jgi:hypothetical protein
MAAIDTEIAFYEGNLGIQTLRNFAVGGGHVFQDHCF